MKKKVLLMASLVLIAALLSGCALPTLLAGMMGLVRSDSIMEPEAPDEIEDGMALYDYEESEARESLAVRDRKSTRLNSSHPTTSRMPSSA